MIQTKGFSIVIFIFVGIVVAPFIHKHTSMFSFSGQSIFLGALIATGLLLGYGYYKKVKTLEIPVRTPNLGNMVRKMTIELGEIKTRLDDMQPVTKSEAQIEAEKQIDDMWIIVEIPEDVEIEIAQFYLGQLSMIEMILPKYHQEQIDELKLILNELCK